MTPALLRVELADATGEVTEEAAIWTGGCIAFHADKMPRRIVDTVIAKLLITRCLRFVRRSVFRVLYRKTLAVSHRAS